MKPADQTTDENPGASLPPASNGEASGNGPEARQDSSAAGQQGVTSVTLTDGLEQAYEGFDPAVHAVDTTGRPVMKKGGGFARKRGRKAGETAAPQAQGTNPTAPQAEPKMSNKQVAVFCVASTTAICKALFQDDVWRIKEKEEFEGYVETVENYFKATGGANLSPIWGPIVAGVSYAAPRLDSPPTVSRIGKMRDWIKARFTRSA